ncbi:MAG: heavy-metal-associated domain-containing protein [Cyanobacteria bacterium REEB417]|nr:heavy-metal-associated domain-containing protein [Cyanobacteria bacterium REEB417]
MNVPMAWQSLLLGSLLTLLVLGTGAAATNTTWLLKINGMVCAFCAQGIQKKLSAVPGISDISVDMATRTVRLRTGEGFRGNTETIRQAIKEAGYVLQSIEPTPAR